jgi:leader peptidase (prepilin peptidase)/N-methyltransferase
VAITVVDWRSRLIPSRLVLPATAYVVAAGGVIAVATGDRDEFVRGLICLVLVRSFFWVLWFVRSAGMGFGDVRLAALLGFALGFVGPAEAFVGAYAGFIVFAFPGVLLALVRWNRQLLKVAFPFGPFMIVGAIGGLVFGGDIGYALTH